MVLRLAAVVCYVSGYLLGHIAHSCTISRYCHTSIAIDMNTECVDFLFPLISLFEMHKGVQYRMLNRVIKMLTFPPKLF